MALSYVFRIPTGINKNSKKSNHKWRIEVTSLISPPPANSPKWTVSTDWIKGDE